MCALGALLFRRSIHSKNPIECAAGEKEAKRIFIESLKIYESVLGQDHIETSEALYWLSIILMFDDLERSLSYAQRSVAIRERELGRSHELTVGSQESLDAILEERTP